MRLGLPEIAIVIVVVILILVVTRIVKARRSTTDKGKTSGEMPIEEVAKGSGKALQRLRALGIVFLIIGIISLLAGMSLFKWVYWSFLWSFIAMAIAFTMLFISKRK